MGNISDRFNATESREVSLNENLYVKNIEKLHKIMFSLIKQVFVVLLNFSESLATKSISLNGEPCMVRSFFIDLSPFGLKYYSFMSNLDKCTGSFNFLSPKIYVPKETRDINVKAFNMITNNN